jgi:hypothetical protein
MTEFCTFAAEQSVLGQAPSGRQRGIICKVNTLIITSDALTNKRQQRLYEEGQQRSNHFILGGVRRFRNNTGRWVRINN